MLLRRFKSALYPWYCVLTGRGGKFLAFRKELHARRAVSERRMVAAAAADPQLFRENNCPACNQRILPREEFTNDVGFHFAVCPHDGTVFMDPIPTDATLTCLNNDPAETFLWIQDDEQYTEAKPGGREDLEAMRRMTGLESGKLLEVGCANGACLLSARERYDAEGCELNDATAATARGLGLNVTTGDIQNIPGEARFDVIIMLQVIEHLPSPADSLGHVRRLLKPGGYFYFNTPSIDSASFALLRERHVHVSSFGHVSLFNEKSLQILAERTRFEVVAYEACGHHDLQLHDLVSLT